ncbi:hypothetical protein [Rheinheimera sp. MMS21-TC3]|uniref:hypothetical protein n=1 Tax=Rheinheimera sp. MMS21-TC3 TaxID=3072790 RepID=UPI0028C50341|nr:hypothetical protein [Rheinheimera sp. MMS21-TC3]WNO60334.1 hypothetical protein RDV63_05055 [Rheinheimera sp. MMS21-TC3]
MKDAILSKLLLVLILISGTAKSITLESAMQYSQSKFNQYEETLQKCMESRNSEITLTVDERKLLSNISYTPFIILYLEDRAFQLCALEEKSVYIESLILLENLNKDKFNKEVVKYLQNHKLNNFNATDLEIKINYSQLPSETRQKLEKIQTLQIPFNGLALKELVWPNN